MQSFLTQQDQKGLEEAHLQKFSQIRLDSLLQQIKNRFPLQIVRNTDHQAEFQFQIFDSEHFHNNKSFGKIVKKQSEICLSSEIKLFEGEAKGLEKLCLSIAEKLHAHYLSEPFYSRICFKSKVNIFNVKLFLSSTETFNLQNQSPGFQFVACFKKLIKILDSIVQKFNSYRLQFNRSLADEINKWKDCFEDNRITRDKCTKISLHSQEIDKTMEQIVNSYQEEISKNSPICRKLYGKFKQRRGKISKGLFSKEVFTFHQKAKKKLSSILSSAKSEHYNRPILAAIKILEDKVCQKLTEGGFGETYKVLCDFYPLKTINPQSLELMNMFNFQAEQNYYKQSFLVKKIPLANSSLAIRSIRMEIDALKYIRNHVCQQIAEFFIPQNFQSMETCLYSKYYEYQLMDMTGQSLELRLKLIMDVMVAIRFLHSQYFVHRDIKPSNIRVNADCRIKLIDFGTACSVYSRKIENSGLKQSEQLCKLFLNEVCYSPMYTLKFADARLNNYDIQQYEKHQYYDMYALGLVIKKLFEDTRADGNLFNESLNYLYRKCMEPNPDDRFSPEEAIFFLELCKKLLDYRSL